MLQAVIFDMDGVIIDSELEYLQHDLEFARTKNPNVLLKDLFPMVGSSRQDAWEVMAAAVNNGQTWEELRDEYRSFCDVYSQVDYTKIFRLEVTALLQFIQSKGLKLAVASSTQLDLVTHVLNVNQIRDYFETVISGAQFKRSKPNPEIYHYTAGQLGVPEAYCLAIEDSTFGITAAHRAGMKVAALEDNRFNFNTELADYKIKHLDDIRQIIEQLL